MRATQADGQPLSAETVAIVGAVSTIVTVQVAILGLGFMVRGKAGMHAAAQPADDPGRAHFSLSYMLATYCLGGSCHRLTHSIPLRLLSIPNAARG